MKILDSYCKIHKNVHMRESVKTYCPECEGYFSAGSFNQIRNCPFLFDLNTKQKLDPGRAYPLIKGTIAHAYPETFNKSLKFINLDNLNTIFKTFNNFTIYMKTLLGESIINSGIKDLYSFYLFKKETYEDFKSKDSVKNMIPIIVENWEFIPFSKEQFDTLNQSEKPDVKRWTKIGIHNIIDEAFVDTDGKAIVIDYKSYPRKESGIIGPIKSGDKKYQLITGLLTTEYQYNVEVKYIMNVDLGTKEFPNISYYYPTPRGISYYKKALFEAYRTLFSKKFIPKYGRNCISFCNAKDYCPETGSKNGKKLKKDKQYKQVIKIGIDITLYEVLQKNSKTKEVFFLIETPHVRRSFRNQVITRKYPHLFLTKGKEPFRKRNLKWKEWEYITTNNENELFIHLKTRIYLTVPEKEFKFKKNVKLPAIKTKTTFYMSGSGTINSTWHSLYNITQGNYPRLYKRMLYLTRKKDVEIFVKYFVVKKHKKRYDKILELFVDKKHFLEIDW